MGQSRMDNPEILATLGTQYTGQINVRKLKIKNGQSRDIDTQYTGVRMGQSRMDNPEILATLATQYTGQINVREN